MKKALIIAYFFPPMGGGGVQRTAKFVKYLTGAGIEPVVLTVTPRTYSINDDSLMNDIPENVRVYRTFSLEPSGQTKKFRAEYSVSGKAGILKRVLAFLLDGFSKLFLIPDAQIGWLPFSLIKGLSVIKKENIDVIYATGNPFSAFLTARLLGKLSGIPFVVDFRDPWTLNNARVWPNPLRKYLEKRMESKVVHAAAGVICVSDGMAEDILKAYPNELPKKFVTLTNGYDSAEFEAIAGKLTKKKDGKFTLIFTGTILDYSDGNAPGAFFEAFSQLIKEDSGFASDTCAVFAGKLRKSDFEAIEKLGLKVHVKVKGYVPHAESVGLILSSDVLLFFLGNTKINRYVLTGKVFEYLGSRKPILAIASEGPAAALIAKTNAGFISGPEDIQGLKNNILKLYNSHKNGNLSSFPYNLEEISRYDRKNLADVLAGLFMDIINEKQMPGGAKK